MLVEIPLIVLMQILSRLLVEICSTVLMKMPPIVLTKDLKHVAKATHKC